MKDWNGTFELVNPALIVIDHRYQRDERPQLIASISAHAAWEPFSVVTCAKRANNVLVALDGQQRLAGVKTSHVPPKRIPVVWFPVATVEEEARIFEIINEARMAVLPLEKHKARLVQKEPFALAIERAAEKVGFSIGTGSDPRTVASIAALNSIYNEIGEEGLVQMFAVIRDAWPHEKVAKSPFILKGVAQVISESNGGFHRNRITTSLARHSASTYLRKAEELKLDIGGSKQANIRRAFKALAKV